MFVCIFIFVFETGLKYILTLLVQHSSASLQKLWESKVLQKDKLRILIHSIAESPKLDGMLFANSWSYIK